MRANIMLLVLLLGIFLSCEKNKIPLTPETDIQNPQSFYHIEHFIGYDQIFHGTTADRIQDFDRDANFLYIHPTGPYGLYRFSLTDKSLQELVRYPSGNYITQDSIYVFYEISGMSISRFNLQTNATDLEVNLSNLEFTNIDGMDAYQHNLYVLMHNQQTGEGFMAIFDFNGNLIETIPYPRITMHMAIHNDIVYAIYYPDNKHAKLSRFDLKLRSFWEDVPFPTENWDGFRIWDDQLYFTDFKKREIDTIPISEIN